MQIFQSLLRMWRIQNCDTDKSQSCTISCSEGARRGNTRLRALPKLHDLVAATLLAALLLTPRPLLGQERRVRHVGHSMYQMSKPSAAHHFLCVPSRSAYSVYIRSMRGISTDQKPVVWYSRCSGQYRIPLCRIGTQKVLHTRRPR